MQMNFIRTTCPFCGTGCSINLVVKDGKVVGSTPYRRSPVNEGKTCQKGTFANELINSEARITTPMIKKGDQLAEASWDEALGVIADKCKGFSGADVAVVASANATNEDVYALKKLAKDVFRTDNFTSIAAVGVDASAGSIEDITNAGCIVAVGNIVESHPVIAGKIANAKKNGAKVIAIDTIYSPMAKMASEFIKAKPGLEAQTVKEAAYAIEGESLVVLYPVGMSNSEGTVAAAAKALADEKGGVFCALPAQSNARGVLDIGVDKTFDLVDGKFKAYYIMGEDLGPLDADFVVVQDSFMSGSAKSADVVLPAAVYAEVDGTIVNAERRIQLMKKAQEPVGESKPNWEIVAEVAAKLGNDFGFESAEAIFTQIYPDITYESLLGEGVQKDAKNAVIVEGAPLAAVSASGDYPFVLTTGPSVWHGFGAAGTMSENCPSLIEAVPAIFVRVNNADAKNLGINTGDMVKVSTEKGAIPVAAMISDDVDEGVIFVPTICIGENCICMLTGGERAIAAKIEKEEA